MRIPLEHFATTPVFALGPNSMGPDPFSQNSSEISAESDGSGSQKWFHSARKRGASTLGVPGGLWGSNTAGSAPTSPVFSRKCSSPSGTSSCFAPIVLQKSQLMTSSLTSFAETEEEDEYGDRSFGAKSLNYGPGSSNFGPGSLQHPQQPKKTSRSYFGR